MASERGCACAWQSEQDALHWGYYCECRPFTKLLLPPCAGRMRRWMDRCPGRYGCPFMKPLRRSARLAFRARIRK